MKFFSLLVFGLFVLGRERTVGEAFSLFNPDTVAKPTENKQQLREHLLGFLVGLSLLLVDPGPSLSLSNSVVFDSMDDPLPWDAEWIRISKASSSTVLQLRTVPPEQCKISSEKGDILAIEYVAKRLGRLDDSSMDSGATVYDASLYRGTGSDPFFFVLGSGVMIPGVDRSLYNMCPGEIRLIRVPPSLAAGLLDPMAKSPVEWRVELISIDDVVRQENNDELMREERILRVVK